MDIAKIAEELSLKILTGAEHMHREVRSAYCSDLLSRVMGSGLKDGLWITVQTHMNVVAVATLLELACVVLPEGIEVEDDVLARAQEEGVPVLSSGMTGYELSGRLYQMGIGRNEDRN